MAASAPKRSIQSKLNRLVLLSVGSVLLLAALSNLLHDADLYLAYKRDTLQGTASAFGAAASEAVARGDRISATQALRAVGQVPGLLRAEVVDLEGEVLAEMGDTVRLASDVDLDHNGQDVLGLLFSRTVQVSAPVRNAGRDVGRISLVADTSDLPGRLVGAIASLAVVWAAAMALGLLLAHRLQRSITSPLRKLTHAMAEVARTQEYRPVTGVASDDETGFLATQFNSMIEEVRKATDELLTREAEIIERLSRAGEQRDDQTGQHVVRVAKISGVIARRLGLDPKWTAELCRASPMHDVGKISIPDAILFKPGRLDPEERAKMEEHAEAGYSVLQGSRSALVQLAAEIAISHHEKWDGTGYPRRVAGSSIPLSGRITAVADVCDALLSERPYKKPWTLEAVKTHLAENAGSHFDPACVEALLAGWSELQAIYQKEEERAAALAA